MCVNYHQYYSNIITMDMVNGIKHSFSEEMCFLCPFHKIVSSRSSQCVYTWWNRDNHKTYTIDVTVALGVLIQPSKMFQIFEDHVLYFLTLWIIWYIKATGDNYRLILAHFFLMSPDILNQWQIWSHIWCIC